MRPIVMLMLGTGLLGGQAPVQEPLTTTERHGPSLHVEPNLYGGGLDDPWNQVHRAFFHRQGPDGRTYGQDVLAPYLWPASTWLLRSPRFERAQAALDRWLLEVQDASTRTPTQRAVFQHDLWAVFDWLAEHGAALHSEHQTALMERLAKVIRRVSLTADQMARLTNEAPTDTAEEPRVKLRLADRSLFLYELFEDDDAWIVLSEQDASHTQPLALSHAHAFRGHSGFSVLVRFPGGRAEGLAYLERLRGTSGLADCQGASCGARRENPHAHFDHQLPSLPVGTRFALLSRMLLVDRDLHPVQSPIIESLQLREIRREGEPAANPAFRMEEWQPFQDMAEFELRRALLFNGKHAGLAAVRNEDLHFKLAFTHGNDPFQHPSKDFGNRPSRRLDSCFSCHSAPGILSVNSYTRAASGPGTLKFIAAREAPRKLIAGSLEESARRAEAFKRQRKDWQRLERLMRADH